MMKPTRLKTKEMKEILDFFRIHLPKNCHEGMGKIVAHIKWLENERINMERELKDMQQPDMFKKQEPKRQDWVQPRIYSEPEERAYEMLKDPKARQVAINLFDHTHIKNLKEMADVWAERHNLPKVE